MPPMAMTLTTTIVTHANMLHLYKSHTGFSRLFMSNYFSTSHIMKSLKMKAHTKETLVSGQQTSLLRILAIESKHHIQINHVSEFHTSSRKSIHPLFWLAIKPMAKFGSVLTGR
jgi:hypothetical protein